MKASELRLGNSIYNTKGEVDTVIMDALKYMLTYPDPLCQAKPIPLTEEWLLKFGFETDALLIKYKKTCGDYVMSISANAFSGSLKNDMSWFISILTGYGSQPVTLIGQYVHQLQNLYFALTGEELIVKE